MTMDLWKDTQGVPRRSVVVQQHVSNDAEARTDDWHTVSFVLHGELPPAGAMGVPWELQAASCTR